MKRWIVSLPIAGSMSIEVEGENKEKAIECAWKHFNENGSESFDLEWEAFDKIAEGNVLHAPQNEAEATPCKERGLMPEGDEHG